MHTKMNNVTEKLLKCVEMLDSKTAKWGVFPFALSSILVCKSAVFLKKTLEITL